MTAKDPRLAARRKVLSNMTALIVLDLPLLSLLLLDADLRLLRFVDATCLERDLIRSQPRVGRRQKVALESGDLIELDRE